MAPQGTFPLHVAIWDDDAETLEALLERQDCDLEVLDPQGNTPLLLAYRMGRNRMARMLLAAGAYAKVRTDGGGGWEGIQVAALTCNPDLVRIAVQGFLAQTDSGFNERLPDLQARLESLPDFQCTMTWSFDSWIPLLGKLLPSDTYSIFKRGSSLRLDTTLLGMTGLRWERGSVSLLVWGTDMPRPGAMYVTDNDMKTAADARLAFTHPQDVHIQDWVRKLLTSKAKITDFWSRDTVLIPVQRQGLLGGWLSKAGRLLGMENDSPRGRLSDPRLRGASSSDGGEEQAAHAPPPRSPGGTPAVDESTILTEDVGVWSDCAVYDMKNLCVTDTTAPPLLPELKLESWWLPEYSRQASDADAAAAAATGTAYASASLSHGVASAEVANSAAPEALLKPLHSLLRAIKAGKINEHNASSATMADVEGVHNEDAEGGGDGPVTIRQWTFEGYFGCPRRLATKAEVDAADGALAAKIAAAGRGGEGAAGAASAAVTYVHSDGRVHRPSASTCEVRADKISKEDKSLDARVYFSKDFPITVDQFLPVAEMMARTSKHAANLRRFFSAKMPAGAGFPVRFSLPVMFGITATISFEYCDASRPIPKSVFEIPSDFKMGAYVERGFIRQM